MMKIAWAVVVKHADEFEWVFAGYEDWAFPQTKERATERANRGNKVLKGGYVVATVTWDDEDEIRRSS